MSEEKAPYTFERLEGSRPPVQDDWGWQDDEAEDINPLDGCHYRDDDEADALAAQLTKARREFETLYNETPPVFQARLRALGVALGVLA